MTDPGVRSSREITGCSPNTVFAHLNQPERRQPFDGSVAERI